MTPWLRLASELTAFIYARAWALAGWAIEFASTRLVGRTGRLLGLAAALYVIKRAAILLLVRYLPVPPAKGVLPAHLLAHADSRFAEVNGLAVHHTVHGEHEPALILLHGFAASASSWREVVPTLSAAHTVVAYDRPAFGLTERPVPETLDGPNPYGREAQVSLLMGLMDALEIQRAVLVGHSAGGAVALETALAHPERVAGLVLVAPAVYTQGGAPGWLLPALRTKLVRRIGLLLERLIVKRMGARIARRAWHDPTKLAPQVLDSYLTLFRTEGWDRALWELVVATTPHNLPDRLAEVTVPTLVVTGDHDRVVPTAESLRLAEELPNARLALIEAAGHVPHEEQPAAFLAAVRGYLAKG